MGDTSTELSDDKIYRRLEQPKGILRWEIEVPALVSGEDAFVVSYDYTVEHDRNYVVSLPSSLSVTIPRPTWKPVCG